ncbi:SDR family NAD(P)-dependent oxidoreductase [Bradyrhizobium sp. U87765 SZCCT0131]|uniref:SDR family oxidoreductase n=1 Tax=unclassified Bradyrhizobium TaxID=2631580 RepID=UPI001BAA2EDB|nr:MULTISPECIES: SDR family NAD(P)-dependent oxidoreductase [unclassified Bradyrhizobium]MBR1221788.1 SDR family NAD(P)-dependent oxidoreductase [Bradyrhizobium sp. U87765 SZCCT0131]MBR1264014.1 SDR family NAD(P)-dependent oxidoreductase [Bradyrhizobium sp. U87765 SZCCT0134]MBR1308203.1 SDR family NAD(P)-dependent oxidoreductase [Bradyrhizobium sp. U87765 SZCCT0110]MBR1320264.1 SDR family NAD(P)-dependent oxidoreductase [Bradyrhizobium sp. U87765 SZCCT0109]MBR1348623.1 SDR family NAD(P)-depend
MATVRKIAWITGGGSGIGLAGAEALAADGWRVVISGRRAEVLDAAVEAIRARGGDISAAPMDVGTAADAERVVQAILAEHGRIDLLVNSAGVNVPRRSWEEISVESWDHIVDINLNGLLYCIRAVLPAMRVQQDGIIINVASWAGRIVSKLTGPAYTATKHAVVALTHSLNMEEFRHGIRACALSPGEVATPIMKQRPVPPSEADMARMLQGEDLGRTIAFIAGMPPRVCVNEILISPTWNRSFVGTGP